MERTMKAAVVHECGQPISIEEVPVPVPGPGEVLVRVMASGVCHTDLHAAEGDWPVKPRLPFIPGHEGAGIVAVVAPVAIFRGRVIRPENAADGNAAVVQFNKSAREDDKSGRHDITHRRFGLGRGRLFSRRVRPRVVRVRRARRPARDQFLHPEGAA